MASQARFHEQQELNFSLLSDPDGSAARRYQVFMDRGFARRVTFVVDTKGTLRAIVPEVDVNSHGTDLVDLVRELQFQDE